LRIALPADAPVASVLALWPALLTVAAIEQDLLGLEISRWRRAGGAWQAINLLNEIRSYLLDEDPQ
ncbi:MAG: hypothetical protein H0V89_14430, partial [Deltaproteobacteria bacterium]|nr:hypothetical protein [Deltaproteobacteria bacterium]